MLNRKKIAVVVPSYNEESQIEEVIRSMPKFVDRIVVVDDCSTDKTAEIVKKLIERSEPSDIEIRNVYKEIIKSKYNRAEFVSEELKKILFVYLASIIF